MILFINVYLDINKISPLGQPNSRYKLKNYSNLEIFLYTLESYRVIEWSNVVIYCELHESHPDQKEFYDKIREIFPEASLYKTRNAYQSQWQQAILDLDKYDDDLIWYAGNHDHPYLAPNHIQLHEILDALNNCNEQYKGAVYSHHPDNISWIKASNYYDWHHESKLVCTYRAPRAEGIMIVNKALFKSWWFDYNYGESFIPRADWKDVSCQSPEYKIFMPIRLMCHHFDGYTFGSYMYDTRDVPPLEIPEGFWDKNIIIDYCSSSRQKGNLWINPMIANHKSMNENGVDLKCMIEDLPLFWKSRIKKIYKYKCSNKELRKARNRALYEAAVARRLVFNLMTQKGINWSEVKEFRPKISLKYLKELFSFK